MEIRSAWQVYVRNNKKWMQGLVDNGTVSRNATVWRSPDGSLGVGQPTLEQMDDEYIMDWVDEGQVSDWID